jgi:hypothetical protein
MLLETYRNVYHDYLLASTQSRVLSRAAREFLGDFPRAMPADLGDPMRRILKDMALAVELAAAQPEQAAQTQISDDSPKSPFFWAAFTMFCIAVVRGDPKEVNFERMILHQELVMQLAHMEAFVADTVRVICKVHPEVLKRDRKIEWTVALSCNGKDELHEYLTEMYVFELGWLPFRKRLDLLKKELGLAFEIDEDDIRLVEDAADIRHLVVHNGGRVSQEYLTRTKRSDIALGEFVSVSEQHLSEVIGVIQELSFGLFRVVLDKFFEGQTPQGPIVSLRRKAKDEPTASTDGTVH